MNSKSTRIGLAMNYLYEIKLLKLLVNVGNNKRPDTKVHDTLRAALNMLWYDQCTSSDKIDWRIREMRINKIKEMEKVLNNGSI